MNEDILNRIIEYARLNKNDTVLEIGAGYGNLTAKLAGKAGRVIAVEVDPELAASLGRWDNVDVIIGDALAIEFPPFNKVVANLPYSISSPVTFRLLKHGFVLGILMYQYEFAKRMVSLPGSKDYSRLSVAVQYYADIELLEIVPSSAFTAPPKVRSAVVKLVPRPSPYKVKDEEFFMKFISAAFSQRRKKLRNAILSNAGLLKIREGALKKLPADLLDKRAESLSPEELAKLADILADERIKYYE